MTLDDLTNISLSEIKFIRKTVLEKLREAGIETVKDIIFLFPYRYEDLTQVTPIKDLKINQRAVIVGRLRDYKIFSSARRKIFIIQGLLEDSHGSVKTIWYNQPFLVKAFRQKPILRLIGVYKKIGGLVFQPNKTEIVQGEDQLEKRIIPLYPKIQNLNSKYLEKLIKTILDKFDVDKLQDYLPSFIQEKYRLNHYGSDIKILHQPKSLNEVRRAKTNLELRELILIELANKLEKKALHQHQAPVINFDETLYKKFLSQFDFCLTADQEEVIQEILKDLTLAKPMNRLLQGEVGSGKTLIAEIISLFTLANGYQTVMMVPTEVLALQQFQKIKNDFKNFPYIIGLISSSHCFLAKEGFQIRKSRDYIKKLINLGHIQFIIGTHSLIENEIEFPKLGLVIIDEQQKFGVEQRKKLLSRTNKNYLPHFLSMSATPIPRTLAMALYADLDISILKTKPPGRQEIKTYIVPPAKEQIMWNFVKKEVEKGHQIFVICPRIEEKEAEVASVKAEYQKVKEIFPDINVAMLHGKMKGEEKQRIIHQLKENEVKILVSSSVVEVGIDLPLATVIIIDGAEMFGLSQLYQLRGRVGRSAYQSFCFLKIRKYSKMAKERLKHFLEAKNAFELARRDLLLRGPGEFLGKNQSGFPDLAMKALTKPKLIALAQKISDEILEKSPDLTLFPYLKKVIKSIILKLTS